MMNERVHFNYYRTATGSYKTMDGRFEITHEQYVGPRGGWGWVIYSRDIDDAGIEDGFSGTGRGVVYPTLEAAIHAIHNAFYWNGHSEEPYYRSRRDRLQEALDD